MRITTTRTPVVTAAADAVIFISFEGAPPTLGVGADAVVAGLYESGEFQGKPRDLALIHAPAGLAARRLILAGGGKAESFDAAVLRRSVGAAARLAKSKSVHSLAVAVPETLATESGFAAAVEGVILASFEPDAHKTDPAKDEKHLDECVVVAPGAGPELEAGVALGTVLAESQNFTRALVNEPANLLPPLELAARARAMAAEVGLECEVLDEDRMRQLGMGSLLGVARGSSAPPALVVLRHRPAAAVEGVHLGLVGKGVTFDTGGISIKPADSMEKMKYDMAGAATVMGAMRAIALLKPALTVTAFAPCVENMLNGEAQRPGDIVTTLSGKTVEVLNTDAEGRLILNDAITYAKGQGCTHLVDAATLTGSVVVALGHVNVGAFTNDQPFCDRVLAAARAQGEKLWQMPMDEEYKDLLDSAFADMANIGTRYGGSISAAHFLKAFADPAPWVHLDIAGTAWFDEAKPFAAKGPSGVCLRTMVELARSWR